MTAGTDIQLADQHRAELVEGSGIDPGVIEERGYRTVWGPNDPFLLKAGFATSQRTGFGWIAPLYSPLRTREHLFKPQKPRQQKYEYPAGHAMVLDVHPRSLPVLGNPEVPLWVVEGTKKGDALVSRGHHSINLSGVYNWRGRNASDGLTTLADWEEVAIKSRLFFLAFDSDASSNPNVASARARLARWLVAKGASVSVVHIPSAADSSKQGPDDFLVAGGTVDALLSLAEPWVESEATTEGKKSQATRLVDIALESGAEFWRDPEGRPFVTISVRGHREHYPLNSRATRDWLSALYYHRTRRAVSSQAQADALSVLRANAMFEGPVYQTYVRLAEEGGRIHLDLCDADWRAVEIDTSGWRIVDNPPVRFRRAKAMLPLPVPVRAGTLDEFRQFLNIRDEDWPLVAGWLVAAVKPKGPYPHLDLLGEQGSAKTTAARYLRLLIDPNTALSRSDPREARDLAIAANNGWVVSLDNLSGLPVWLSDALCRLSTGGGFATRSLYTDDEEAIFEAQRPVILNGINEIATRSDLLDRGIAIYLQPIPDERRKTESALDVAFHKARPRILGALLEAVVVALRRVDGVTLNRLPRMADFATWAAAAEPGLGLPDGAFLAAYVGAREAAHDSAIEYSPIGSWLMGIIENTPFEGTASDLLKLADDELRRRKHFPASPRSLADAIRRLAPDLRAAGVVLLERREGKRRTRMLRIERLDKQSSAASAEEPQDQGSVFADEKQFDFWNQADDADDADAGIQTKPDLAAEVLEL